jgi:hypothetical protein
MVDCRLMIATVLCIIYSHTSRRIWLTLSPLQERQFQAIEKARVLVSKKRRGFVALY